MEMSGAARCSLHVSRGRCPARPRGAYQAVHLQAARRSRSDCNARRYRAPAPWLLCLGRWRRRGDFDENFVRFGEAELLVDERHEVFWILQVDNTQRKFLVLRAEPLVLILDLRDLAAQSDVADGDAIDLSRDHHRDEESD